MQTNDPERDREAVTTPTKAENPSADSLPDRLLGGAVWAVSTADEWADTLSPRRIRKLYEAADAMREAAALLAQRSKNDESL